MQFKASQQLFNINRSRRSAMKEDANISSDEEFAGSSSEDEIPLMSEVPDDLTYDFPTEIMVYEDDIPHPEHRRKLQIKIERCSDKLCAFASYGTTRLCCTVSNPVNEADVEDFEAGIAVKVIGANYINETSLCDLMQYIIPSNRLKRTFIQIRVIVYSDRGAILPVSLMATMFALSAAGIDVKGVVTAVSVLCTPDGTIITDPSQDLEEKARDRVPGYGYVTAMKIMEDGHMRWYDMEGLPKKDHLAAAFKKAAEYSSSQYTQMAKMVQQLTDRGQNVSGVLR